MTIDEALKKIEEGIGRNEWVKPPNSRVALTPYGKQKIREILAPFHQLRQLAEAAVKDARYDPGESGEVPADCYVKVEIIEAIAKVLSGRRVLLVVEETPAEASSCLGG